MFDFGWRADRLSTFFSLPDLPHIGVNTVETQLGIEAFFAVGVLM
jgi:hypothetical protein